MARIALPLLVYFALMRTASFALGRRLGLGYERDDWRLCGRGAGRRLHYRSSYLQPDDLRTRDMKPLPGEIGPVLHAGKYACPHGDYAWYRLVVGAPVPRVPPTSRA